VKSLKRGSFLLWVLYLEMSGANIEGERERKFEKGVKTMARQGRWGGRGGTFGVRNPCFGILVTRLRATRTKICSIAMNPKIIIIQPTSVFLGYIPFLYFVFSLFLFLSPKKWR
jgi:hypothetical protein